MKTGSSPIIIFAHGRPAYLKRCLDSIAQQGVKPPKVTVVNDGAKNRFSNRLTCKPEDFAASVAVAENHPIVDEVCASEVNNGVAIQQYDIYEAELLSRGLYRFITFLDDDVILGPDYLHLTELLIPWMIDDPTLFSVTPAFMRTVAADRISYHLDTVEYGEFNWIGYTMDIEKWEPVREKFQPYWNMVKDIDYQLRPHTEIRKMIHGNGWMKPHTSQDCGKDMAIHLAGMRRLRCSVNRGYYIGELGVHGTPALYQAQGWTEHRPFSFPSDSYLTSLSLREEGFTSQETRAFYHTTRRDMNATDFFHSVVKRYVEPRAHTRCLQEIKASWPKVERDAAKVGYDVPKDTKELQMQLSEAQDTMGTQEATIANLTAQLEAALNPPPKPIVSDGHHDPRDDEPVELRD